MSSSTHNKTAARRWLCYLVIDPLVYLYTVVLGTLSLLSSFFDRSGRIQHGFARLWSSFILRTAGCPVSVEGLDKIDTSRSYIYAVNHISALDIPALYMAMPFQFRIMAKRELFRYPFLGWHLKRSGQIPIERENARASLRSLIQASEAVRNGMPLLVFPEGGRSPDGQIKPFLAGVFYVGIKAAVEIVPMALVGTYEALPMNTWVIYPRQFRLVVGEPISTAGLAPRDMEQLAARTQKIIEDLYYAHSDVPDPRAPATAQNAELHRASE
ncbi:MAG TPA: lysophospholipid acyltransferase family protein [Clostridia bacterium]|nr:lysophospholipid acyltransferase family protein [Clostridia bacterium]